MLPLRLTSVAMDRRAARNALVREFGANLRGSSRTSCWVNVGKLCAPESELELSDSSGTINVGSGREDCRFEKAVRRPRPSSLRWLKRLLGSEPEELLCEAKLGALRLNWFSAAVL